MPLVMSQLTYSTLLRITSGLLRSAESGLANLIRISIPSRALPRVLSCTTGFAGSPLRGSWLISPKVSKQFSPTISFRHCFISSSTFTLLRPPRGLLYYGFVLPGYKWLQSLLLCCGSPLTYLPPKGSLHGHLTKP